MTKVSRRNAITRAAMQNLDKQIWRSRITIPTKLKLYNNCILPIFLYGSWVLGSHQERCTQDRRPRPMVSAKAVRNQMVPSRAEWRGETDNRATPPVGYCPSTASSLFGHIARMPDETDARSIITASPSEHWRRPPGRPRTTRMKTIRQDLRSNNLSLDEAITVAQNRPLWRLMSAFGATHP